jgi:hypothetical protein
MVSYYTSTASTSSTSDTWYGWSTGYSETETYANGSVWYTWATDTTTNANYSGSTSAWITWIDTPVREARTPVRPQPAYQPPDRSYYEEMQRKKALSEEKACELLGDIIGRDQLDIYKRSKQLLVEGKHNKYILNGGDSGYRLRKIDEKKKQLEELCVHLADQFKYPVTDNILAILLSLANNEKEVVKLANQHGFKDYVQLPEAARISLH